MDDAIHVNMNERRRAHGRAWPIARPLSLNQTQVGVALGAACAGERVFLRLLGRRAL